MHFVVKMPENGRKKRLRENQTTKRVAVMFLLMKLLSER